MLYITQLIYIKPGKEGVFHQFESLVIPLMKKYGGQVVQRIRPTPETFVDGEAKKPYEIHIVSFPSEDDLIAYAHDPIRSKMMHFKDESVESILMFRGEVD